MLRSILHFLAARLCRDCLNDVQFCSDGAVALALNPCSGPQSSGLPVSDAHCKSNMQHALNELCFACMVLVLVDPFPLVFFRSLHRHMLRISHVFELCHAYQSLGQDAHSARFAEICSACSVQASHSGFNRVVTCSGRTLDFGPAVRGGGRRRHIVHFNPCWMTFLSRFSMMLTNQMFLTETSRSSPASLSSGRIAWLAGGAFFRIAEYAYSVVSVV